MVAYHERLTIPIKRPGLGKHMLYDDILFLLIDGEMSLCILQELHEDVPSVLGTFLIQSLPFSPVIEKEIVKQTSPCSRDIVKAEYFRMPSRKEMQRLRLVIDMMCMVVEIPEFQKFFVIEDLMCDTCEFNSGRFLHKCAECAGKADAKVYGYRD